MKATRKFYEKVMGAISKMDNLTLYIVLGAAFLIIYTYFRFVCAMFLTYLLFSKTVKQITGSK